MFCRGWNYVDCIESIVWAETFDPNQDCWKLNTFCRDVLATPSMDELGQGITPPAFQSSGLIGLILALISGTVASALVVIAIRGGFRKREKDKYGDVQFSAIQTHEMMVD